MRGNFLICHPERSEAKRNAVEGSRIQCQRADRSLMGDPSTPLRSAQDDTRHASGGQRR